MKKVTHSTECKRVFSRYDKDCPRCQELMNGAEARRGWGTVMVNGRYINRRQHEEAQTIAAIRAHDFDGCAKKNGGVCTHFDY